AAARRFGVTRIHKSPLRFHSRLGRRFRHHGLALTSGRKERSPAETIAVLQKTAQDPGPLTLQGRASRVPLRTERASTYIDKVVRRLRYKRSGAFGPPFRIRFTDDQPIFERPSVGNASFHSLDDFSIPWATRLPLLLEFVNQTIPCLRSTHSFRKPSISPF